MRHRILRVVDNRLGIDPAGGVDSAHIRQQGAEFVEGAEIRGRCSQDIDEGLLGILPPIEGPKQNRALDLGFEDLALDAMTREEILKLYQFRFLRQSGRPVAVAAGNPVRDCRLLLRSGRGACKARRRGLPSYHLSADSPCASENINRFGRTKALPNISRFAFEISGSKFPASEPPGLRRRQDFV